MPFQYGDQIHKTANASPLMIVAGVSHGTILEKNSLSGIISVLNDIAPGLEVNSWSSSMTITWNRKQQ